MEGMETPLTEMTLDAAIVDIATVVDIVRDHSVEFQMDAMSHASGSREPTAHCHSHSSTLSEDAQTRQSMFNGSCAHGFCFGFPNGHP